jgi:hypothetical protein
MQEANEMKSVYELIVFCAAVGAAGYKFYQHITTSDEATIRQGREIISNQQEQLAELREMTAELNDITTANATLLQDSDTQLRELEVLLFPDSPMQKKTGTSTRDLLNTLNQGQPRNNQNRYQEETSDQSSNDSSEKIEKSENADFIIEEDNPADELLQHSSALNFK